MVRQACPEPVEGITTNELLGHYTSTMLKKFADFNLSLCQKPQAGYPFCDLPPRSLHSICPVDHTGVPA